MKKYRFHYSPVIYCLMVLVLLAAGAGIVLNVLRCTSRDFDVSTWNVLTVAIMFLTCTLLILVVLSLFIRTDYVLKGAKLTIHYGIIKNEIALAAATEIVFYKKTEKLVLYYDEDKYVVILLKPEKHEEFIADCRAANDKLRYDTRTSPDEDEPEK